MEKSLAWLGTAASILGAFVVAMGAMLPGYTLFLLGSASWLAVAARRGDRALGTLNLAFLAANILGFARAII